MKIFYEDVFKALNKSKVRYLVADGVANVLCGDSGFTNNLDLVIFLEEKNFEKLSSVLRSIGYKSKAPFNKDSFVQDADPLKVIDIFFNQTFSFEQIYEKKVVIKIDGITIPIICKEHFRKIQSQKSSNTIYQHLDIALKTNYTQRLKWLQEANNFVNLLRKKKIIPTVRSK